MKTNYEVRYASNPTDAKSYDTTRLRKDFLIERVFVPNEVNMVYSMYDRMIVGGAMPVGETLLLEAIDPLKAPFFLTRREMGIFNVGGKGRVIAGDEVFELDYKEALYLGRGDRGVFQQRIERVAVKGVGIEAGASIALDEIGKRDDLEIVIVRRLGRQIAGRIRCDNKMHLINLRNMIGGQPSAAELRRYCMPCRRIRSIYPRQIAHYQLHIDR